MSKEAKSSKRKAPKDEKPVKKSKVGKSVTDGLKKVRRIFCIVNSLVPSLVKNHVDP